MKTEPLAVTQNGDILVKTTYEPGETLSELGLDAQQSAGLWAELEADWQKQFPYAERRWRVWRVWRVTIHLDWLFEREFGKGSARNDKARAWWIECWFYRLGLTLWRK